MKSLEERVKNLEEKVRQFEKRNSVNINNNIGIGDTFELAGFTWMILDINEEGYYCLASGIKDMKFDEDSNDWKSSSLRKYLNGEYFEKICDSVGSENIVSFERDLISLDGRNDYGTCEDKVSLLTFDEYRKYREVIELNEYWWLLTSWGVKRDGYERNVTVVFPSGNVGRDICRNSYGGVRPFCIFDSSIFESGE
nr:MAG TPA: hypothetical protein [Caudoviricetes sp.]